MQPTPTQVGVVANIEVVRSTEEVTALAELLGDLFDRVEGVLYDTWLSGDEYVDPLPAARAEVRVRRRLKAERRRRAEEERGARLALESEHKAVQARLNQTQLPPCDDT